MDGLFPLIIVIVAGLISFFSKIKDQNQDGTGRQKPFIPPGLDPMHPKHFERRQTKTQTQTTINENPKDNRFNDSQVQTFTFEETSMPVERKSEFEQDKKPLELEDPSITKAGYVQNLNKQKLVEGIIMAEVLGAPRALKPLQSSRYTKNKKLPK